MARTPPDPQIVKLSEKERDAFTHWLTNELTQALQARSQVIQDGGLIDVWQGLYEQAPRPRQSRSRPDAADLASYIPTEYVDSMAARLSDALLGVSPICTVEGWGEASHRAAKVEAFHEWQARNERLKTVATKAIRKGLIEGNGIVEVIEQVGMRKTRGPMQAAVMVDAFNAPILHPETMELQPRIDNGKVVPHDGNPDAPYLDLQVEKRSYIGRGPQHRILSCKDFLYLPVHAHDRSEVWGYAKRFWKRVPELEALVDAGIYEKGSVEKLNHGAERMPRTEQQRQGLEIAPQEGPTVEKELWEVHLYHDIDDDGIEEWLIATVSIDHTACLRIAFDNIEQARFVDFCPFPREDSVWGYSFVGHKLWTLTDEHTALRNMKADRQAMAVGAPILRMSTSTWDPDDQPFGPFQVIDIRSKDELTQMPIADVPASTIESERDIHAAAERIVGLNDAATIGVTPSTNPSATQIATVAQASYVRVKSPLDSLRETLEDWYQLRHTLWERALSAQDEGMEAPQSMAQGLSRRGISLPTDGPFKFTAADLKGKWQFVPYGSVETANRQLRAQNFNNFVGQVLPALMKLSPAFAAMFQNNPQAAMELFEQALRVHDVPNAQVFLQQTPGVAAPQGVMPQAPPGMPPMLQQGLPALMAMLQGGQVPPGMPPMAAEPQMIQ